MVDQAKPVRLSGHARDQFRFRGATAAEVAADAIRTSPLGRAELGTPFNAEWNGKRYSTKQVRPIFVEEADEIVVVTVYVYYL
jgi:hypothetical protein